MSKIFNIYKLLLIEIKNWIKKYFSNWRVNLKNLFLKNIREKFIAILLAVLTFGYVRYQDVEQRNLFVPLKIEKVDELTFVNDLPKTISLFVSGNRSALNDLDVNTIVAHIDLRDITSPGVFKRSPILEAVPENIQVIRMNPQNLLIELSNLDKKIIRIEPAIVGSPKRGNIIERIESKPSRLLVFGPRDILSDINGIQTETIDIKGIDGDKSVTVGFSKNVHPALRFDTERKIEVNINIESEYQSQNLVDPILVEVLVDDYFISVNEAMVSNVSFEILKSDLNDFNFKEDILFSVDASKIIESGEYTLPVQVVRKKKLRKISFQPRMVNITLQEKDNIETVDY